MSETNYVFMLRDGVGSLEVQYNQQSDAVYLAEAQIIILGEYINGGCNFDIDNVEDMDRIINYLTELRDKIKTHYSNQSFKDNGKFGGFKKYIPKCKECSKHLDYFDVTIAERENELCFECERKQIQSVSIWPPVNDSPNSETPSEKK